MTAAPASSKPLDLRIQCPLPGPTLLRRHRLFEAGGIVGEFVQGQARPHANHVQLRARACDELSWRYRRRAVPLPSRQLRGVFWWERCS